MSESSFNTVIVRDSRINDVSTKIDFKVAKGPSQSNYQQVQASSKSNTNINFNIVPTSENTIIDRNVTITVEQKIRVVVPGEVAGVSTGVVAGNLAMSYGHSEALNQFPFNSSCLNTTCDINQCSSSVNTQDMMHVLLRMTDDEKLSKYNSPHMSDRRFKKYSDMVLSQSNPLNSFREAKGGIIPRGSHPIEFEINRTSGGVILTRTHLSTEAEILAALTSTHVNDSWVIDITFKTTEPILFMSPFLYSDNNNNNAGLYGIKSMNLVFNLDTTARRVFCSGSAHTGMTVSLLEIKSATMNLNYLSTQASDLLSSKNVLPYTDYQKHLTTNTGDALANTSKEITSQALQLNQIPNKIYIIARKEMNTQTLYDSNSFFAIEKISINFNNVSGILANATVQDLYNMSATNGSRQDFYEFLGNASDTNGKSKSTIGSILVIDPSRDMNLPDYLSNGSIGQFSFQCNLTAKNTSEETIKPELLIITEFNGLFITQAGQSTKQTGILTTDLVMNSTSSQFGESSEYVKSFGKGNGQNNNSALRNVPFLNMNKSTNKSGGAYSGGAKSGGAYSGGGVGSQLRNLI